MSDIKRVESLIQGAYGAEGYHVSRVTGKALIVTLPASGQNFDDLIVELRAMGCSVHFETMAEESPPRVELYVQPGAHQDVSEEPAVPKSELETPSHHPATMPPRKQSTDFTMLPPSSKEPRTGCISWKCLCIFLMLLLATLFVFSDPVGLKNP